MKKTAAGLILFTKLPHKGLVAILSRRGEFDYEDFEPETYPGIYEATIGGGIESGEHLIEGLMRETEEEMGEPAAKLIRHYLAKMHHVSLRESNITTYTYTIYIPHFPLKILKPHRSSDGIKLISRKDIPAIEGFPWGERDKHTAPPPGAIWMLSDQLEGLKKGFELYRHI